MVTEKHRLVGSEPDVDLNQSQTVTPIIPMGTEERKLEEPVPDSQTSDLLPRDRGVKLANFLPPVDVAIKIYRVDAVDVLHNTFTVVFSVLLDWEDPSLYVLHCSTV